MDAAMTRGVAFIGRRAVAGLFTLIVMTSVTFWLFWATKTEPSHFLYAGHAGALTPYEVVHGHKLLGTDKPKLEQWWHYETHLLRFDFGKAWEGAAIIDNSKLIHREPIAPVVYPDLRITLSLLLGGVLFVILLAVPLGAFAGSRIGSVGDRTLSLVALLGVCTHPMVIGILTRTLFADHLHWFPPYGYCPLGGAPALGCHGPQDWAYHLALPWLSFALLFLALYFRMVRTSVAETLNEDFVRTARAKGASELRVVARHVLPTAAMRILTMVGMEIGTAIGVCIYLESSAAFGLGGLASEALYAMGGNTQLDLPLILAIVFLISLIVIVGNLVVDALYVVIDPRPALTGERRGFLARRGVV
ncbi:MAG TPA: ABC transporter permease [Gaiellaceae bacterium]|nr:ABC transporter permease [Gaiellaceae bacterium]